jgi:hypothetical protein
VAEYKATGMLSSALEDVLNIQVSPFAMAMRKAAGYRRFCTTKGGRFGLVPPGAEVGDLICIPVGAQTPFVLRQPKEPLIATVEKETWKDWIKEIFYLATRDLDTSGAKVLQLVGECYVQGMMRGEFMGDSVVNGVHQGLETFIIQ